MTYTLWIEKYAFEPPHEFEDYREEVMRKIRPKLEQLELKGFKFVEEIDGEHRRRDQDFKIWEFFLLHCLFLSLY